MTDIGELVAQQRRVAQRLVVAADDNRVLLEVARELAATLYDVADDERLWSDLSEASASTVQAQRLAQLVLLDWQALLEQAGHGNDEALAAELAGVVGTALDSADPDAWSVVPELLGQLADDLLGDAAAPEPAKNRHWWRALRDKVAYGVSALRRVVEAAVLIPVFKKAAEAGGVQLVTALLTGAAVGSIVTPIIIAAAVVALGVAAVTELRRCFAEQRAAQGGDRLELLFENEQLHRGRIGFITAQLDAIELSAEELFAPYETFGPQDAWELPECRWRCGLRPGLTMAARWVTEPLAKLRRWGAEVGAELASAWSFVAAHTGAGGIRCVHDATDHLASLRVALAAIAAAFVNGAAKALREAIAASRSAIDGVRDALGQLMFLLGPRDFGPAARRAH